MSQKVMVAMSGGVDSSVAALLVKNQGFDTGAITMRVWSDEETVPEGDTLTHDNNCIAASEIAAKLGIPHYTVSYGESFRRYVVDHFVESYKSGLTPNPCVECNRHIKFGALLDSAHSLGYGTLATGHYARIIKTSSGNIELRRAFDQNKDQSYFLWGIRKNALSSLSFPLGELTKQQIRQIAYENGFSNSSQKDSQDLCFISDGDYVAFIRERYGCNFPEGDFVDLFGNVIGRHRGIVHYTVGQRKGLGQAFGEPMFVERKNGSNNTVTLCSDAQLYKSSLTASFVNLLVDESFERPVRLQAKIRYRHTPATATVTRISEDSVKIDFDIPQRAISPGQSAVLYDGDTVIGGGIIQ